MVVGNCEAMGAEVADGCGCCFDAGSAKAVGWFRHISGSLDHLLRQWMAGLPKAVACNPWSSWRSQSLRLSARWPGVKAVGDWRYGILNAHCGLPFTQILDGNLWLNASTIGMLGNDGTERAWYAVMKTQPDDLNTRLKRLD